VTAALWLLAILGVVGAFDTFYYHEWKAKLPAGVPETAQELRLHAARDFFYAILFATLPWVAWHGYWVIALVAVIIIEIVLTLWDFVEEIAARKILGDVYAGERVTHAIMGIIYGAIAANLIPNLIAWWKLPTALSIQPAPVPEWLRWALVAMAIGVFLSGVRDLYAAFGLPHGGWPWKKGRA
jgi:phosphatidylglycerophosphate synthase